MNILNEFIELIKSPYLLGALSAVLGFLLKALWDRFFSERTMPTLMLLSRPNLTEYGIKRLNKEALRVLSNLQIVCTPPLKGKKLSPIPNQDTSLFIRNLNTEDDSSSCPLNSPQNNCLSVFLILHKSQNPTEITDELKAELENLLAGNSSDRNLIKNVHIDNKRPLLWIYAPNLVIKDKSDLIRLLTDTGKLARNWINKVQVILETYLSLDIIESLSCYGTNDAIINLQDVYHSYDLSKVPSHPAAASYAYFRSAASLWLRSGQTLGNIGSSIKYKLPQRLIDLRLHPTFRNQTFISDDWFTISIYGPAGSGKSETALLLSEYLKSKSRAVCLSFSTPNLLNMVIKLSTINANKDTTIETISRSLISENFLPEEFRETNESRTAFTDALSNHLIDLKSMVCLFFDDIHAHREVEAALKKLLPIIRHWNMKCVIIGRKKIEVDEEWWDGNSTLAIHCKHLKRDDAETILRYWTSGQISTNVISALNTGWPSMHSEFSTYLLRMIYENIDDIHSSPNELMKDAINRHLSSLENVILYNTKSDKTLLAIVKDMLLKDKPKDDILAVFDKKEKVDIPLLFGLLAWHANYGEQTGFLDAKLVPKWSSQIIPTEEVASALLKAGRDAEIFIVYRGGADWRDKNIAEGCTALYLIHEMDRLISETPQTVDNTIAEMISKLASTNSIDILPLALDMPDMVRIIEAIAKADRRYINVADRLITPEFIARLSSDPQWVDKIAYIMFNRGQSYDKSKMSPFALVLAKLIPFSNRLKSFYDEMARSETGAAQLAINVIAIHYKNNEEYFTYTDSLGANDILAAEMAAYSWDIEGGMVLYHKLCDLALKHRLEIQATEIWNLWCTNQKINKLVELSLHLTKQCLNAKMESMIQYKLAIRGITLAVELKHIPSEQSIKLLRETISLASTSIQPQLISDLIGAFAYFSCPNLVEPNNKWVFDAKHQYALPQLPYRPMLLKNIFSSIQRGFPTFYIPSKTELSTLVEIAKFEPELIRDGLPQDYIGDTGKVYSSNFQTWDGKNVSFFLKDQINSYKVHWRPVLRLNID